MSQLPATPDELRAEIARNKRMTTRVLWVWFSTGALCTAAAGLAIARALGWR